MKKNLKPLELNPGFLKNAKGKTTHAYIEIDEYNAAIKEIRKFEKIKKKEGIRWVRVSDEKKSLRTLTKILKAFFYQSIYIVPVITRLTHTCRISAPNCFIE